MANETPNLITIMDLAVEASPTKDLQIMVNNNGTQAVPATRISASALATTMGMPAKFPTPDNVTIVEDAEGVQSVQKINAGTGINLAFLILTQAEYDDITTKDANTMYIAKQPDGASCAIYLGELHIV